jgi:hypothetical protein
VKKLWGNIKNVSILNHEAIKMKLKEGVKKRKANKKKKKKKNGKRKIKPQLSIFFMGWGCSENDESEKKTNAE